MTKVLHVAELTQQLEPIIASITPSPIHLRGTLTSWQRTKAWQRGELVTHIGNEVAAKINIGCPAKRGIAIATRLAEIGTPLEPPVDITIIGTLTYHQRWGFRFELQWIDPDSVTTADAKANRKQLVARFTAQGLLDRQKSLTVGKINQIGLLVPRSGHAGRNDALDILTTLSIPIIEHRVPTSGPKAASKIASGIATLATQTDIIAIVRGGGAASELHVWDTEPVATAIATCDTPIVIGVGHSPDDHLSRQVAWHGANTPTAAAQHIANHLAPTASPAPAITVQQQPTPTPTTQSQYVGHITPTPIRANTRLKTAIVVLLIILAIAIAASPLDTAANLF